MLAVLVFHGGLLAGGFLGVSAFFTLSGFLICGLLLAEIEATGVVNLRRFWARRARRLLPAAFAAIALVLLYAATVASAEQVASLRGDVLAALGYVANWRFVASGRDYGRLFADPSPVQHFWSLAIEEQFYLVFPLLVAGVAWLVARRDRRAPAAVAAGAVAGPVGAPTFVGDGRRVRVALALVFVGLIAVSVVCTMLVSPIHAYYGTDTRATELLVGALAACLIGTTTQGIRVRPVVARAAGFVGPTALVLLGFVWAVTQQQSRWLYHGGLGLHAGAVALVIVAAQLPGPVAGLLSWRPLCCLGRISYGVYLYHWPIFLWLNPARTHITGAGPLLALRLAVTLAVAVVSWFVLERPVLGGTFFAPRHARVAVPAALAVIGVNLAIVTLNAPVAAVPLTGVSGEVSIAPAATTTAASAAAPVLVAPPADSAPSTVAPPAPLRVLLVGDSIALTLGAGLVRYGGSHPEMRLYSAAESGCSLGTGGTMRALGYDAPDPAKCAQRNHDLAGVITAFDPTDVIVMSCLWDVADRKLPGDDHWREPDDPVYSAWTAANLEHLADTLGTGGAKVAWATCPRLDPVYHPEVYMGPPPYPVSEPARVQWMNGQIRAVADKRSFVHVVDVAAYAAAWPGGELDPAHRPDGVHFNEATALDVTNLIFHELGH